MLHHGRWPHGEHWLYEAADETYLPLLGVIERLVRDGVRPAFSVGMTPVLCEQLAHPTFRRGFPAFLTERRDRAKRDASEFERKGEAYLAKLALRAAAACDGTLAQWAALDGNIVGALAEAQSDGHIAILGSNATHTYQPLVVQDATARASIRVGLATSTRHFGRRPRAVWLPECAYRPPGPFVPLAGQSLNPRWREGVGRLWVNEGVEGFVIDGPTLAGARSEFLWEGARPIPVPWEQTTWDHQRGWRDPLTVHRVSERGEPLPLTVFARSAATSEPVWSGRVGYPGDPAYLEFHARHEVDGLRYWRVTASGSDLSAKAPYEPGVATLRAAEHARHFAGVVRSELWAYRERTGRDGVVTAPFDAELFGHWWSEGPTFLECLSRELAQVDDVCASTLEDVLDSGPAAPVVELPEGSWGAGGDHRVWARDDTRFYWDLLGRAEDRFQHLWHAMPWRSDGAVASALRAAGRELLLLSASDWPFVISTGGAVDYGIRRISDHAARFDELANRVADRAAGRPVDPIQERSASLASDRDDVFPDLDLSAWGA